MGEKRRVSVLVPYKVKDDSVLIFLQKRAKSANRGAGMFGFFGGGIQNSETPEEALVRESKEEIDLTPTNFYLYKKYDLPETTYFSAAELYLFILFVADDFEEKINIQSEGEYGKWFSKEDYINHKESIAGSLFILDELYEALHKPEISLKTQK